MRTLQKEEDVVGGSFEKDVRAVNVLMAQGRGLLAARSCAAAAAKFRLALAHNRFHVPALEGLAEALEKLGQEDEAALYHRKAGILQSQGSE